MTKPEGCRGVLRHSIDKNGKFKLKKQSVMTMLSGGVGGMCEEEGTKDPVKEFITTGRTGRRNAMADILNDHAIVSTSDLPDRLQALSTTDKMKKSDSKSGIEDTTMSDKGGGDMEAGPSSS